MRRAEMARDTRAICRRDEDDAFSAKSVVEEIRMLPVHAARCFTLEAALEGAREPRRRVDVELSAMPALTRADAPPLSGVTCGLMICILILDRLDIHKISQMTGAPHARQRAARPPLSRVRAAQAVAEPRDERNDFFAAMASAGTRGD